MELRVESLFENDSKFYVVESGSAQALLRGLLVAAKLILSGLTHPANPWTHGR